MKTTFTRIFLLILAGVILVLSACKRDGLLDFADGLVLNVNTDILKSPVTIIIVNGNPNTPILPNNLDVDILGDGRENLYTLTGKNELNAVKGVINIGMKETDAPDSLEPLHFTVRAQAPGFLPAYANFSIGSDLDDTQFITVRLVQEAHLPEGVSMERKVFIADENGLNEDLWLESPLAGGKEEQMMVKVPQGTQLLDKDRDVLNGEVEVKLIHFDNRSEASLEAMSDITDAVNTMDKNGDPLGSATFEVAAGYVFEMTVNGVPVKHFSQPLEVSMELNPGTINPMTMQPLAVEDRLPVWSWLEYEQSWQKETMAEVVEEDNQLRIHYTQDHLSRWMVGGNYTVCSQGAQLSIQSGISSNDCDRYYLMEIINVETGFPVVTRWSNTYKLLNNGKSFQLTNMPEGIDAQVRIWEGTRNCRGALLAESNPFDPCGADVNIQLNNLDKNDWYPISVNVSGYCESAETGLSVGPTGNLLYRETGCGNYGFLGKVVNGEGCTPTLRKGAAYDFKTRYGGEVFEFENIVMETTEIVYTLSNGDDVLVRVEGGPDGADIELLELPIPEDYCHFFE
jgi:hypothetical protein